MLHAAQAVAQMGAIGLGLPVDAFVDRMRMGPHLLAPTGCDLLTHGTLGQVFAG